MGSLSSSAPAHDSAKDIATYQDLMGGFAVTRSLQAIADFGIADALGESPETPDELARKVGLNADALGRVLRFIATKGIFQDLGGRFSHTSLSRLLREDHPQSQKGNARMGRPSLRLFAELDHSLRTGRPAAEALAPGGMWAWLRANPDLAKIFDEGMASKARADIAGLIAAYDFSKFRSIADIGGGKGHLLKAVLETAPRAEGTLFDQPVVIDPLRNQDTPRLTRVAGDFFKDQLPKCDAYLLMNVIHDWDEKDSIAIFKNVRKAAADTAKLLLIETPLPETPQPHFMNLMDLFMLAWSGGRERKSSEYEALLKAAGWRLDRVIPSASGMAIFEAAPV